MEGDPFKRWLIPISAFLMLFVVLAPVNAVEEDVISGYYYPSGVNGNSAGYYSYLNYCPLCHHQGTLADNPKGVREGEITCYKPYGGCDADFDGTSGCDKWYGGCRASLVPYEPKPEPEPAPVIKAESSIEVLKDKWFKYEEGMVI